MSGATQHQIMPRNTTAQLQYIWALEQAYASGVQLYDPDAAMFKDAAAAEKIRRDPVIMQAMHDRATNVAGARDSWICQPGNDTEPAREAAAVMEDLIRQASGMQMARYLLANAIFDSKRLAEIRGTRRMLAAGTNETMLDWWVPTGFRDIDKRRWRRVAHRDGPKRTLTVHDELRSIERREWVRLDDRAALIFVTYEDAESRLGYGRGLQEAAFHCVWAKSIVEREGMQGLEKWAQGWVVVEMDTQLQGGEGESVDDAKAAYLKMLKEHKARFGGIVIPKGDTVQTVEVSGQGGAMVDRWMHYYDDILTRLYTGALLPSGGGGETGSMARGVIEENTQERVTQFDRGVIDEAMTRDLVTLLWRVNRENFVKLGLADAPMPLFRTINEKREDPQQNATVIETLLRAGVPVRKDEVYERTGFTQPTDQDEVFEGVPDAGGGDPFGGLTAGFGGGDQPDDPESGKFRKDPDR